MELLSQNDSEMATVTKLLKSKFRIKDLGTIRKGLGMEFITFVVDGSFTKRFTYHEIGRKFQRHSFRKMHVDHVTGTNNSERSG